jgi:hypothetical protein
MPSAIVDTPNEAGSPLTAQHMEGNRAVCTPIISMPGLSAVSATAIPAMRSTASYRHNDNVQGRLGLQHLQRDRPLSRDDLLVVVGMNPGQAPLFCQPERMVFGFVEELAVEDDLRAIVGRMFDLDSWGVPRHHDDGRNPKALRVIGDTLRMIPGGCGDAAGATLHIAQGSAAC